MSSNSCTGERKQAIEVLTHVSQSASGEWVGKATALAVDANGGCASATATGATAAAAVQEASGRAVNLILQEEGS